MDRNCPRCSTPVAAGDDACPHCGGPVTPGGGAAVPAGADVPPVLPGRYTIQALLGRGGMGRVYLCRDSILDVDVAVKVLRPELAADEKSLRRIEAEARAAARLRGHPRILSLYAFENCGDTWFLVMEYAPGGTLFARLREAKRLPERGCRRVGIEVAEALAFAHGAGVLHRDIKPGNVLLDIQGGVKVADFGLAHIVGTGSAIPIEGTPVYMAPEAIGRRPVDARSDLYALGAMLYELATGAPPFRGSVAEIRDAKLDPGLRSFDPREFRPDLSEEYAAVVRRLLEPDPALRFPDASAVAEALRALDRPVERAIPVLPALQTAPGAARAHRGAEAPARGPGMGLLMGGSVLAAAAGVWLFLGAPGVRKEAEAPAPPPPAPAAPSVPETPAAKKAADGLVVITKPAGATVFVDGNSVGMTEGEDGLVVPDLADGTHRVSAHLEDHETDEQTATWKKGEANAPVVLRLVPQKGIFAVEGGRPGAKAVLRAGDRVVRQFTLDLTGSLEPELLEEGSFTMEIAAPGHRSWTGPVRIRAGRNPPVQVEMPESDALLSLDTDPTGAKVLVDDREVGFAPLRGVPVPPGKHTLHLDHPEASQGEREEDFRPGEAKDLGVLKLPPLAEVVLPPLPDGVLATLDGKPLLGPVRRRAGFVNLVYVRDGQKPQKFALMLQPGSNPVPPPGTWEPIPGFLDLSAFKAESASPKDGVRLVMVGPKLLTPPLGVVELPPGIHTVALGKTGQRLLAGEVRVRAGETVQIRPPDWSTVPIPSNTYRKEDSQVLEAVEAALGWLSRHQEPEGFWRANDFNRLCRGERCRGPGQGMNSVGVTGLSLMALMGEQGVPEGDGGAILSGLAFLAGYQGPEGFYGSAEYLTMYRDPKNKRVGAVYDQPIATLALVRGYRATMNPALRAAAQKGLNFIMECRNPYLAWRYGVRPQDNDTSVTVWMVRALHEGKAAGLEVDPDCFEGAKAWLDKVTMPEYGRVGYTARDNGPARPQELFDKFPAEKSESLTAAGVLMRYLCGATHDDEYVKKGTDLCMKCLPLWDEAAGTIDYYYWHYGTLAMARVGGDSRKKWNEALRKALLDSQRMDKTSCRFGSWDAMDPWFNDGGRVYSTAINAMTLQALLSPKPPPPGKDAPTRLSVATKPPGARAELEGKALGTTPLEGVAVPAGRATLRLFHPERGEVLREVEFPAFTATDLGTVEMPAGVTLDLSELPQKVTAVEKGRVVRGRITIPAGKVRIDFHSAGNWPQTCRFDLAPGGTAKPVPAAWEAAPEWEDAAVKGLPVPPKPTGDLPPLPPGLKTVGGRFWSEKDRAEMVLVRAGGAVARDFLIDRTEVTVGQFLRFCMGTKGVLPVQPRSSTPSHPEVNVTFIDAREYALWAGKRLPTPDEWQRAAFCSPLADDGDARTWLPYSAGNFDGKVDGFDGLASVGRFLQGMGAWGCLDSTGNAEEWCEGGYAFGGSWATVGHKVRKPASGAKSDFTGFRCVLEVPVSK